MADSSKTVEIIFSAVDRTAGGIASAMSGVESAANRLENVARPIADVTLGILKFETAILASGAALTLFAVKTAGDFDAAFREISTLVDAPAADLDKFRLAILDYASDSTQSLAQVTTAIYGAISAGVKYTDALGMVGSAEQLAVASKADLGATLVLLVSSLNAYGKGAESAEHFSDILFTTVKQGQTTLPELADGLAQVTSLAAGAGVPFEVLTSAVAALTAAGLPTSQAITGIKAALSNIVKPTAEAVKEAQSLGIQFDAAALQSKGFEGVLQEVFQATGGNVAQMAKLFGSVEGLNTVIALTGNGAAKFAETLIAMQDSTGATGAAFDKMVDGMNLGAQKMQNAIKVALVGIGTPLLDEFGGIAEAIAAIFQAVGKSVGTGALGDFIGEIEKLAQQAETTLNAIAKNLPEALSTADFSGFSGAIKVISDALSSMFQGADLTTAEGLAKVIELLGSGFMTLSTFSASTVKALVPFVEVLASLAKFVAELNPEVVKVAGTIGGVAIVVAPVASALASMAGAIGTVSTAIVGAGGLAAALTVIATGPVGIALGLTAMAAAAYAAGTELNNMSEWGQQVAQRQREQAEASALLAEKTGQVSDKLKQVSATTGLLIPDMETLNRLEREGAIVFDEASGKWVAAKQKVFEAIKFVLDAEGNLAGTVGRSTKAMEAEREATIAVTAAYYEMRGTTPELARAMAELETPLKKVETTMKESEKTSESFRLKMEELASNERIRNIELAVGLQTAMIDADVKKAVAIIGTLDTAIKSTGDLLGGLFGNLTGSENFSDKWAITKQIDEENRRREEAFKLQKQLTEAQIESMEIKNNLLRSGEGMIKIDSSGLEPALEMVMWNIIEKVQLRVNEEASELLIGMGV